MEFALAPSTALSRKPVTERSGVEGYPGPSARTRREAAPNVTFRRGLLARDPRRRKCRGHESSGPRYPSSRAGRAEPRGRSSSPAGGHIDTGRPGRWPRVEASRPPRGLRRLSVRRPSDLWDGRRRDGQTPPIASSAPLGSASSIASLPVIARLFLHHRRRFASSSDFSRIIVGVFPHHRRVIGPSPAPPPRARRSPAASPARRRW